MFYKIILFLSKIYTKFALFGVGHIGKNVIVKPILNTMNKNKIWFGNNVNVGSFSWISVSTDFGGYKDKSKNKVRLKIGNNVDIGNNAFIIANNNVEIGDNVMMGPYVYISDHIHLYEDIKKDLRHQPLSSEGHVLIGKDVFIGIRASILPNVTIGERAVIGANAVVTKDIPPYSVVVGNPARIVKKYDFKKQKWVKTS